MTVILYERSEGEVSDSSGNWVAKISKVGSIDGEGDYKIFAFAEITGANANRNASVRVTIDGVERAYKTHRPAVAGQYGEFSAFGLINVPADLAVGVHTIELQFRTEVTGTNASVRRARILIEKF